MDAVARTKLLQEPWKPKSYDADELARLLKIHNATAQDIILSINGGPPAWVAHHDLVQYVIDTMSITQVPNSVEELPVQGQWLIQKGWYIDPARKTYKWKNEAHPALSFNLRSALRIQLALDRVEKDIPTTPKVADGNIIDADFEIR